MADDEGFAEDRHRHDGVHYCSMMDVVTDLVVATLTERREQKRKG